MHQCDRSNKWFSKIFDPPILVWGNNPHVNIICFFWCAIVSSIGMLLDCFLCRLVLFCVLSWFEFFVSLFLFWCIFALQYQCYLKWYFNAHWLYEANELHWLQKHEQSRLRLSSYSLIANPQLYLARSYMQANKVNDF